MIEYTEIMAAGIRQVLHSMDSNHPQTRSGHQRSAVYRVRYTKPLPGDHIITGIPTLNKLTNLLALTVVKHFRHEMVPRQSPPNPANVFLCSLKSEFEDNI